MEHASSTKNFRPLFPVVHFSLNPEACIAEIPLVLRGQKPASSSSNIGTARIHDDYRPVAVVLGGGYAETFDQIHDSVEQAFAESGGSGVIWLRHDGSKPAPPLGPEYSKAMIERVRETLGRLGEGGMLGSGDSRVVWF